MVPAPTTKQFNQLLMVDSNGYSCTFNMEANHALSTTSCDGINLFPYTPKGPVKGDNPVEVGSQKSKVLLGSEVSNTQQIAIGDLSSELIFKHHKDTNGNKSILPKPQKDFRTLTIKNNDLASSPYVYIFGADFGPDAINPKSTHHLANMNLVKAVNEVADNPNWLQSYATATLTQTLKYQKPLANNKLLKSIWIKDPFNKKPYLAMILKPQQSFSLNVDDALFVNSYYAHPQQTIKVFPFRMFAMYRINKNKLEQLSAAGCGQSAAVPCDKTHGLSNIYTNHDGTNIFGTQFEATYFPNEVVSADKINNTSGELDNGTTYDASYVDGLNILINQIIPTAKRTPHTLALGKTGGVIFGDPENVTSANYRSTLYLLGNEVDPTSLTTKLNIAHSPDNDVNGFNVVIGNDNLPLGVASACTAANLDSTSTTLEKNRACCKNSSVMPLTSIDFTDPVSCTKINWQDADDQTANYVVFRSELYRAASNLSAAAIPSLPKSEITSGYTFAYADSTSTYVVPNQTQDILFGFITPTIKNIGKKINP